MRNRKNLYSSGWLWFSVWTFLEGMAKRSISSLLSPYSLSIDNVFYDSQCKFKMLRWGTQNPDFPPSFSFLYLNFWHVFFISIWAFPMRFDFWASDFDPITFQMWTWQIEMVFLCGNIRFIVCVDIRANAETNCCFCGLAPRRDALGALHCA